MPGGCFTCRREEISSLSLSRNGCHTAESFSHFTRLCVHDAAFMTMLMPYSNFAITCSCTFYIRLFLCLPLSFRFLSMFILERFSSGLLGPAGPG